MNNLMIGRRIEFSITNLEDNEGIVLDKISMVNSAKDPSVVTGYIVECGGGELKAIQNWRLKRVLPDDNRQPF